MNNSEDKTYFAQSVIAYLANSDISLRAMLQVAMRMQFMQKKCDSPLYAAAFVYILVQMASGKSRDTALEEIKKIELPPRIANCYLLYFQIFLAIAAACLRGEPSIDLPGGDPESLYIYKPLHDYFFTMSILDKDQFSQQKELLEKLFKGEDSFIVESIT